MFARDSIDTFFMRSGAYVIGFLVTVVISNLGQEVKGQVAVVIFVAGLVRTISLMGYDVATIYFLRQRKYDYDTIARNLNSLIPMLMIVWAAILIPLVCYMHTLGLFGGMGLLPVLSCFVIVPANSLLSIQLGFLMGEGDIKKANRISFSFHVAYLLLLLLIVHLLPADFWGVIAAFVGAASVSSLIAVLVNLRRGTGRRGFELDFGVIREIGSFGIRSQAGALAQAITHRVDLFLTNLYGTVFVAGVYSVALNWAELPQFIPGILLFVLFPHASERNRESSIELTNKVSRVSCMALLIVSAAICVSFPFLERVIYGPDYSDAFWPLVIVMPGLVLRGLFRVLMGGVDGLGKPEYSTYTSFSALAATVALSILMIPRFGMMGAAASVSIAGVLAFFVMTYFYRRISKARWSEFLVVRKTDLIHVSNSLRSELLRILRK